MNCDGVFDMLTRGPFPTGHATRDEAVERHLARCASCQELATALRPAVELFSESLAPEDRDALPAYWGEWSEQEVELPESQERTRLETRLPLPDPIEDTLWEFAPAEQAVFKGRAPRGASRRRGHRAATEVQPQWRAESQRALRTGLVAATLMLAVMAGGIWRSWHDEDGPHLQGGSSRPAASASEGGLLSIVPTGALADCSRTFLAMAHPAERPTATHASAPGRASLQCCTDCHAHQGAVAVSGTALSELARSCQVCHFD